MITNVPVANLREIPQANSTDLKLPTSDLSNSLQVTQLLLGEHIIAYEEYIDDQRKIWIKVGLVQQEYFTNASNWQAYPGWIEKIMLLLLMHTLPTTLLYKRCLQISLIKMVRQ